MKVGDKVRQKDRPAIVLAEVIAIDDLGHGEGYERVKIQLPPLGLTRYYAKKELEVVEGEE